MPSSSRTPDTRTDPEVLILGAGLAGLSAAFALARKGISVAVVERNPEVGGLARTMRLGPQLAFDLGGHRFFTADQGLQDEVTALLDGEWVRVQRRSRIHLGKRFFDYPLRPHQAMFSFGPTMSVRIATDYLWGHLHAMVRPGNEETFEDWALARFGRTLYRIFFKPYTEKVWGIPARELSAHWSRERIDLLNLTHALARAVFPSRRGQPRTYASDFLYPRDGIGRIAQRLAHEVIRAGGEVLCGLAVTGLVHSGGRIVSVEASTPQGEKRTWEARRVVSTIPLRQWVDGLVPGADATVRRAAEQLSYRHMIFVLLVLDGDRLTDDTWIYVPDPALRVCRIHEPKNWSTAMAPQGKTSICAELFCAPHEDLWVEADQALVQRVIRELHHLGLLDPARVLDAHVARVPDTHPVYRVGFQAHLETLGRFASSRLANLDLLGRTGAFQYKNMDQVMADGFGLGARLGRPREHG